MRGALSQHSTGKGSSGLYFHASHALPRQPTQQEPVMGAQLSRHLPWLHGRNLKPCKKDPELRLCGEWQEPFELLFCLKNPKGVLQFVTLKHKPDRAKCLAKGINLLLQRFMARQTSLTLIITYIDAILGKSVVPQGQV